MPKDAVSETPETDAAETDTVYTYVLNGEVRQGTAKSVPSEVARSLECRLREAEQNASDDAKKVAAFLIEQAEKERAQRERAERAEAALATARLEALMLTPEMIVAGANVEPPCSAGDFIERWRAAIRSLKAK